MDWHELCLEQIDAHRAQVASGVIGASAPPKSLMEGQALDWLELKSSTKILATGQLEKADIMTRCSFDFTASLFLYTSTMFS